MDLTLRERMLLLIAYKQGYETGHNDTVEDCYTDSLESGIDWITVMENETTNDDLEKELKDMYRDSTS